MGDESESNQHTIADVEQKELEPTMVEQLWLPFCTCPRQFQAYPIGHSLRDCKLRLEEQQWWDWDVFGGG